jgi:two-component system, LytTR family, response regulator
MLNSSEITLPRCRGKYRISPQHIIRVEAIDNYSKIYFSNSRPILISKVLKWFEEELPVDMFARVHRSHLINKSHVVSSEGKYPKKMLLVNGDEIVVSRRRSKVAKML